MKKNTDDPWRMAGLVGTLGIEIFAFIIGGVWLGQKLDATYGTEPIWIAIGSMGGLVLGLVSALFTLRGFTKD